jgi:hypothetical protein
VVHGAGADYDADRDAVHVGLPGQEREQAGRGDGVGQDAEHDQAAQAERPGRVEGAHWPASGVSHMTR